MRTTNALFMDSTRCDYCGLCVKRCPQLVFSQDPPRGKVRIDAPERCIGCLACEEDCQQRALRVHRLAPDQTSPPRPPAGDPERVYDVAIVGAGPAGVGAALRARALGLSAICVERLPSTARAHHPDGGLLFAAPDVYRLQESAAGPNIESLDLTIPGELVRERLQDFALVGPGGRRTRAFGRRWGGFMVVDKHELMTHLCAVALERGVELLLNSVVVALDPPGSPQAGGPESPGVLHLDGERRVSGRVLICAEGGAARLARGAGIPLDEHAVGWSYAVEAELPARRWPSEEFAFIVGNMEGCPAERPYLGYWATGRSRTQVGLGTLQRGKGRQADEPLSELFERVTRSDRRIAAALGDVSLAPQPDALAARGFDGCRVRVRRLPPSAVGPGVIAVGDAIATCGMATTLTAMKTGDLAVEVAARALARGDVSAAGLAGFDRRVSGLSLLEGMSWMHKLLIEAPMELEAEELRELFTMLSRLRLPKLMAGGLGAVSALLGFYGRNMLSMLRRPALRGYLKP